MLCPRWLRSIREGTSVLIRLMGVDVELMVLILDLPGTRNLLACEIHLECLSNAWMQIESFTSANCVVGEKMGELVGDCHLSCHGGLTQLT